jgi:hypothetical protein
MKTNNNYNAWIATLILGIFFTIPGIYKRREYE